MLHGFILLRSFGAPLEHFRVCRYPNRPRADEVKFREMSREIFERVYLPDEWKPAYNAARRTRSQLHWIDLREHPRSFDELGACGGRPRIAKGMAIPMRNGRGRIDAMARCDSPSPCPTARPRSCMRQTRHRGRGSTTSWRQLSPSSSCRRATSGMSYWGTTTWNPGDQAVRLIHPSTTCQSPKTQQDRERGDELTARVFAPGRSILSSMGAIL